MDEIDFALIGKHVLKLAIAFIVALPIGFDREQSEKRLGVRTFPLVAMASAGFILLSESVLGTDPEARSRVIQGLVTGVGFLGGGAIAKRGLDVKGTATAAAIWTTAAIGASVAYGRYEISVALAAATFATLRWLTPLKKIAEQKAGDESD